MFDYNDCRESIQNDLITMLDGSLSFIKGPIHQIDSDKIKTDACQIVVDNFNKISFKDHE